MARRPVGKHYKQVPKKKKNIAPMVCSIVGVALILVAACLFIHAQMQYHAQDEINDKLSSYVTVSDTADKGPQVDWAGLKAINDDIVGWIQIPGTVVNYPVYQGEDNDQYLHTTAEGEYSIGGQIFMDYENAAPGLIDRQTLIYGHHLWNGTMFTAVDTMTSQSEFDKVSTIWYATETTTYELTPLFIYKTDAYDSDARQSTFASDADFVSYLNNLLSKAVAQADNAKSAVSQVHKVLTLETCDYNNDFGQGNGRCLLVCALKSEVS